MAFLDSITRRARRALGLDKSEERSELDVPADSANAGSRETGGGPDIGTMDTNSTTGTTHSQDFVGRAGSDETGDVGMSGGEGRAGKPQSGRIGAARDD